MSGEVSGDTMGIVGVGRISKRILSLFVGNRRMSSVGISKVSPSLILKRTPSMYEFYSLGKKEVVTWPVVRDRRHGVGDNRLKVVGSSHGWLAFFNDHNNQMFLWDPISGRHITLPRIESLPDPDINLIQGRGSVSKLILSCSPDEGDRCYALISYGAGDRLAFCHPLTATHWIPVGEVSCETTFLDCCHHAKSYQDFVYCSKRKVFACIATPFRIMFNHMFNHELQDRVPCQDFKMAYECQLEELDTTPKWIRREPLPRYFKYKPYGYEDDENEFEDHERIPSWIGDDKMWKDWPIQTSHLVYVEDSDNLYLLVQLFDISPAAPAPPYSHDHCLEYADLINDAQFIFEHQQQRQPYKTAGFLALRCRHEYDMLNLSLVDSLEGLAMFVGANQSFAISPSKFPELNLKPNSVYFTDRGSRSTGNQYKYELGVDAGIFDYQNNVILPLSDEPLPHPHEPFWFTPTSDF